MNKSNYFKTMVLVLFVLLINTSFVSVGFSSVLWTNTYGGLGEQAAASIIETDDGGFAIFGNTQIDPNLSDFLLIKIDENGFMQWNHTYDGKGETDSARSFVQTSDGGYALAGQTLSSFQYGSSDFWLIKTDAQGNMEWNKTYGQWFQDDVEEIIETSDGGFALVGNTLSVIGKLEDYYLVKTDMNGYEEFSNNYSLTDIQQVSSLIQTSNGGFALAGRTSDNHDENSEIWVLITDEQGIPEFPSWTILPFFLIATVCAIIVKKRLFNQTS